MSDQAPRITKIPFDFSPKSYRQTANTRREIKGL